MRQSWKLCIAAAAAATTEIPAVAFNLNELTKRMNLRWSPLMKSIAFIFCHMFAFNFQYGRSAVCDVIHTWSSDEELLLTTYTLLSLHTLNWLNCLFVCLYSSISFHDLYSFVSLWSVCARLYACIWKEKGTLLNEMNDSQERISNEWSDA